MKFEYTSVLGADTKGRLLKRPLVELELIGKGRTIKAFGLLDSGADTILKNLELLSTWRVAKISEALVPVGYPVASPL